jgi:hypothetical protein
LVSLTGGSHKWDNVDSSFRDWPPSLGLGLQNGQKGIDKWKALAVSPRALTRLFQYSNVALIGIAVYAVSPIDSLKSRVRWSSEKLGPLHCRLQHLNDAAWLHYMTSFPLFKSLEQYS